MSFDPNGLDYQKLSVEDCTGEIESALCDFLVQPYETIHIDKAFGRTPQGPNVSAVNIPSFPVSIVDGFAVRSASLTHSRWFKISGEMLAGEEPLSSVSSEDEAVYVTTGAKVPSGLDCVVPIESCDVANGSLMVRGPTPLSAWTNIRTPGSDTAKGSKILSGVKYIGAAELSLLRACGLTSVNVEKQLVVRVVSTGAELISGEVIDANRPYIISRLSDYPDVRGQLVVQDMGIIADDEEALRAIVESDDYDVLITTGSLSKGRTDYMKKILESCEDMDILFGQVDLKPGKPTMCATNTKGQFVFALPGNPASCFVTFNLFALPTILSRIGGGVCDERTTTCQLEEVEFIQPDPERPEYLRARAEIGIDGLLVAHLTEGHQRSSRIASCVGGVNCLVIIPPGPAPIHCKSRSFFAYLLPNIPLRPREQYRPEKPTISLRAKAHAFDALVDWMKQRTDVENIDLMNLAGFCRNCLSKWLAQGGSLENDAKYYVYGMDYEKWKTLYRRGAKRAHNDVHVHTDVVTVPRPGVARPNPCASSVITTSARERATSDVKLYVLTISDRASSGAYQDESGPVIVDTLTSAGIVGSVGGTEIVADDAKAIQSVISKWAVAGEKALIVTTGGTGLCPRDVTKEAIGDLIHKRAGGLEHLLLSTFCSADPLFCLSSPLVGTINQSLVVTLPGRPSAVRDGLAVLLPVLPKALQDIAHAA